MYMCFRRSGQPGTCQSSDGLVLKIDIVTGHFNVHVVAYLDRSARIPFLSHNGKMGLTVRDYNRHIIIPHRAPALLLQHMTLLSSIKMSMTD